MNCALGWCIVTTSYNGNCLEAPCDIFNFSCFNSYISLSYKLSYEKSISLLYLRNLIHLMPNGHHVTETLCTCFLRNKKLLQPEENNCQCTRTTTSKESNYSWTISSQHASCRFYKLNKKQRTVNFLHRKCLTIFGVVGQQQFFFNIAVNNCTWSHLTIAFYDWYFSSNDRLSCWYLFTLNKFNFTMFINAFI